MHQRYVFLFLKWNLCLDEIINIYDLKLSEDSDDRLKNIGVTEGVNNLSLIGTGTQTIEDVGIVFPGTEDDYLKVGYEVLHADTGATVEIFYFRAYLEETPTEDAYLLKSDDVKLISCSKIMIR